MLREEFKQRRVEEADFDINPYPLGVILKDTRAMNNTIGSMMVSPDNTKFFFGNLNSNLEAWYGQAGDIANWVNQSPDWGGGSANTNRGLEWDETNGLRFFVAEASGSDSIFYRDIDTAFEALPANVVASGGTLNIDPAGGLVTDIRIPLALGGTQLFVSDSNLDRIVEWTLGDPYDTNDPSATTATAIVFEGVVLSGIPFQLHGFEFLDGGSKMILIDGTNNQLKMYTLATPYRPETIEQAFGSPIGTLNTPQSPFSCRVMNKGQVMYVTRSLSAAVWEYTMNPANTF